MTTICVVGSLNIDLSYAVRTFPVPGETTLATDRTTAFGGKGGNQAVTVGVLGGEIAFVGAVGADEAGEKYLAHLRARAVDVAGVAVIPDVDTGGAIVLVDDTGENLIVVDPGANSILDAAWARHHVQQAASAIVLAQLEIPVPVLEAVAETLPAETTFVLNPAPMPASPEALKALLARADILVPNRKELGQLVDMREPVTITEVHECLRALHFPRTVVVTLGKDGAVVLEPGQPLVHHPALSLEPVDTTGAGDAFCGALVTAVAQGRALHDAVDWAIEVAGASTLIRGAQLTKDPTNATLS